MAALKFETHRAPGCPLSVQGCGSLLRAFRNRLAGKNATELPELLQLESGVFGITQDRVSTRIYA